MGHQATVRSGRHAERRSKLLASYVSTNLSHRVTIGQKKNNPTQAQRKGLNGAPATGALSDSRFGSVRAAANWQEDGHHSTCAGMHTAS